MGSPIFLTCLLTSSKLRATPLSALLLLVSFWHFPRRHSLCLITWDRGQGSCGLGEPFLSPTPHGPISARRLPPYLVGIVEELQHGEDTGTDEQPHLAPNVTCRRRRARRSVGPVTVGQPRARKPQHRPVPLVKGLSTFPQKAEKPTCRVSDLAFWGRFCICLLFLK